MSTNIMVPVGFSSSALSTKFKGVAPSEELGAGIRSGFGIIGYKGKVWSTKFQGDEKALMREDGDGPRSSIEVIIVRASQSIAKIYYEAGFVDGSVAPPDCWSANGITPDGGAPKKQSTTCAGCPKNSWGSKVTEAGKQTKACADSKRLAVVPLNDPKNELMGGPMLLRVPAASLKDLKAYGDTMMQYGFPYFAVATRISFEVTEAYPKFVFSAIRPLTDAEADIVLAIRDGQQTNTILNETIELAQHEPAVVVPATPFETKDTQGHLAAAAVTAPANQPVQPVANPPAEATQVAAAPATRKRRTKAEMEAAAAQLAAKRNGANSPGTPTPEVVQATMANQAAETPIAENAPAPGNFDAMLDSLM